MTKTPTTPVPARKIGLSTAAALAVGLLVTTLALVSPRSGVGSTRSARRDERGLSQSAETAILLAGAVVVAGIVVTVITAFVKAKLPK